MHVNTTLLRKFNDQFKYDDDGKTRDWREIEEAQILEIFTKCKEGIQEVMKDFGNIQFPKHITPTPMISRDSVNIDIDQILELDHPAPISRTDSKRMSLTQA